MMSMAIIAGCNVGSLIGFAKRHRFAVVGVTIMGQTILVAFAAPLVAGRFEMPGVWGFHLMGGVAISANRTILVSLCQQLPVHALHIGLLDLVMALAAGLGNVGIVDWRITVDGAFDIVDSVTIIAAGGH